LDELEPLFLDVVVEGLVDSLYEVLEVVYLKGFRSVKRAL